MIQLDLANLRFRAMNVQGCYMAGIDNEKVKKVLLGGDDKIRYTFYCDVNNGFAILHKTDVAGNIVVADNEIVYELFFGKVEVILK